MRIDSGSRYPSISVAAEPRDDGAEYFGCFFDRDDAQSAIETLNAVWMTPLCGKAEFSGRPKACLYYYINNCLGPCEDFVAAAEYRRRIQEITGFLHNGQTPMLDELKAKVEIYSASLEFEKAAACAAALENLERLHRKITGRMYDVTKPKRAAMLIRPYKSERFSIFYFHSGDVVFRADNIDDARAGADRFAGAIQAALRPLPESVWLKSALVEIFAERYFVELSPEPNAQSDRNVIRAAVDVFC